MPIAVVNGRVSDRSYRRMRRVRPLLRPLLRPVDRFGVQTETDRERLIDLGVAPDRIVTTGNLKFETPEPDPAPELGRWVEQLAAGRTVLVAGSTMRSEEKIVLDGFRRAGGGAAALLVLAPRHPERWDDTVRSLRAAKVDVTRRSAEPPTSPPEVAVLDSLGELASLYRYADAAFIGGTLVPTGGHNPLEAARFAVPVVVGPSMENFRQIADLFDEANAWARAADADELAAIWRRWIEQPGEASAVGRAGQALIDGHRGALANTLELLQPMLEVVRDDAPEAA